MSDNNDSWAVVELMGHVTLAGRVTKPGEYGGLWQIDIPDAESFRTEFFGSQAVYRIRMVSEPIARGYARPNHEIIAYDAPIVTRAEHESAMDRAREVNNALRTRLNEAERKLMALPTGESHGEAIPGVANRIEELWDEDDPDDEDES